MRSQINLKKLDLWQLNIKKVSKANVKYIHSSSIGVFDKKNWATRKGMEFKRSHELHFYHFGSKATKNREEHKEDEETFKESEREAYSVFQYKWGFMPRNMKHNSKSPKKKIKGVKYD